MLDQSFSAENFRKILDFENRKGVYLEGKYFSSLDKITEDIKNCNLEIREKRRNRAKYEEVLKTLYEKRKELKKEKDRQLHIELQEVSQNITEVSNFKIELDIRPIPDSKRVFNKLCQL